MLARSGDEHTARTMLTGAISDAETLRLPHQVQRIIRLANSPVSWPGRRYTSKRGHFTRLDNQLAGTAVQTGCETAAITAGEA